MGGRFMGSLGAAVALALALAGGTTGCAAADDPIAAYRWRSRLILVSAPAPDDAGLRAQRESLTAEGAGVRERDLVLIEAVGPSPEAERLRRRLGLPADRFRAVLVGKDGGAKLASDGPISTERLFRVIDAMPMRRDETGRR